jgi:hypothetical protein
MFATIKSRFKKVAIATIILSGVAGVSLFAARVVIGQKNEPLRPCLEMLKGDSKAKIPYVRLAHYEDGPTETDYYVYSVGQMGLTAYWEPLISVNSGVCRILNGARNESDRPFGEFVSPAIAKKLTIAVIERKFEAMGGKTQFEKMLAEDVAKSKKHVLMPNENYEALKQLGVKIPANVKPFDGVPNPKQLEEEHD